MRKCLTSNLKKKVFLLLGTLILVLGLLRSAHAAASTCVTLVSNQVITATGSSSWIALPITIGRAVGITAVSAVSGTTPSMTVDYQGSRNGSANSAITYLTGTAITAVNVQNNLLVATGRPVTLLPFFRLNYTVSGTTPSFTTSFYLCYEDVYG